MDTFCTILLSFTPQPSSGAPVRASIHLTFTQYLDLPAETLAQLGRASMHPNLNLPVMTLVFLPFTSRISALLTSYGAAFVSARIAGVEIIYRQVSIEKPDPKLRTLFILLASVIFSQHRFSLVWTGILPAILAAGIDLGASRSGNDRLAGIVLGLAMVVKINAGIFLLVFLLERRWRLLIWSAGVFILANLIGLAVFG